MNRTYWPTIQWQYKEPQELQLDGDVFTDIENEIHSNHSNINGIVIVKNGFIVYENYFNGCNAQHVHHVASATKSVLSALVGIAIDKGFIKDVKQKVVDFFPEYNLDGSGSVKNEITIEHLLTMTAPYIFENFQEPLEELSKQDDWVAYALNMLGNNGKVGDFKYSTSGAHLLSGIISKSTGMNAQLFANQYLFQPIGMKQIPDYNMDMFGFEELFGNKIKGWAKDPQEITTGGWGLTLTPSDMARFGFLYLNQGQWNGEQIISEAWIKKSTEHNLNHYGYLWWLRNDNGISSYAAIGDGGNVICCIEELDLVVSIASSFLMEPKDRWELIKKLF